MRICEEFVVVVAVLHLEVEILVKAEVKAGGNKVMRSAGCAELVPLGVNLEPRKNGNAHGHIEGICRTAFCHFPANCGGVFCAYGPVVVVVLKAGADALTLEVCAFSIPPVTCPAKGANKQARNGLELDGPYDVLCAVNVNDVNALAVVNA